MRLSTGIDAAVEPLVGPGEIVRETNIAEDVGLIERKRRIPKLEGLQLAAYRRRVQDVLVELIDESPALQKVQHGKQLSAADFDELCGLVLTQDPDSIYMTYRRIIRNLSIGSDIAIRQIIGMDVKLNMTFGEFRTAE
ncbi:MAG: hypothetical protein IPN51_06605 [Chloracidobacterium sp.]|nr:hypothetical protein [Chloracidobacterium sp.]